MNPAADKPMWESIGEQFVTQYYQIFDSNREQILPMYAPDAMFTFEEHRGQGQPAIKEILMEKLRFAHIQHAVTKVDCHPTAEQGVVILVTGQLKTDNDPPHAFSQLFVIKPLNNSYFLAHDIFRLSIHNLA